MNKPKPASITVDPTLHQHIQLLRGRDARHIKQIKQIVEPLLWAHVAENREWIEEQLGHRIEIPDPEQLTLAEVAP